MNGKEWLDMLLGEGLVARRVHLRAADVVFVKGILEASEGLGALFAEPRGGRAGSERSAVVVAAPRARAAELERMIADLRTELGGALWESAEDPEDPRAAQDLQDLRAAQGPRDHGDAELERADEMEIHSASR